MIGPLLLIAGVVLVVVAVLLLRNVGPAYRIGRTLSAAPELPLAEVVQLAHAAGVGPAAGGSPRYIRTHARISSEEEFPDENDRPLVYRRQRLQRRDGRAWATLDDDRVAVPFGLEDRETFLAVDIDTLGDGLVVVPRESVGVASDLPSTMIPAGVVLSPDTPVRIRIDQLSAIERATVAGMPTLGPTGEPTITAGGGRPLIVTSLAPDEAMRVLGSERRGTVQAAAGLLVVGLGCVAAGVVATVFHL
jgi:hypothetical protein